MAVERHHAVCYGIARDAVGKRRQFLAWYIESRRDRAFAQGRAVFSQEQIGQLGTSSRRFFSGPGINNWDIALLKDTTITESTTLQFRAELFNAFNHAQFGLPNGNIDAGSSFGIVTTANPPRIMQLSMKFLF